MPNKKNATETNGGLAAGFLSVNNISKHFGNFTALNNVSIAVSKGEFVCILGPSGCGKTTLLRAVAGLETPDKGSIFLDGSDVTNTPVSGRGVGIVFQSYALFPNLTAVQNVKFGIRNRRLERAVANKRAMDMLDLVGLTDCAAKYPAQMSGGQQQRVALARALAPEPSMLLLDEPLSALDAKVRQSLRKEIRNIQKKLGITALMVTHDQEEALTMADKVVVMTKGKLAQFARPEEIYRLPSTPFVADFVGSMNFMRGWKVSGNNATNGSLRLTVGTAGETGKPTSAMLGIRPEDVVIGEGNLINENRLLAHIREMEFRGVSYSVSLFIPNSSGNKSFTVEAMLSSEQASKMRLRPMSSVIVYLPPQKLISFVDDSENTIP